MPGTFVDGRADFSDYALGLAAREIGAETTMTFDRTAATSPLSKLVPC